ncbi:hypothetical protein LHYA1_G001112 [Lachnellula hyalina]|uniref:F-box domain-containing protein n=1 Tax=Lachnellula hyalina TaxID=1316788 RepID=A0A8H8U1K7_9HELO|nr:uncharacterized protein LHYA1_G001112 [Lachnellula hyalina]TVY30149.1 hypothetical protein LHYA1_G001112 [Lachnellula hyalina]
MPPKHRRSSVGDHALLPSPKRTRTKHPLDHVSSLSDELLIRILHNLPIQTLIQCQRLSHRFYTLAGDSQIWKNLYYNRFVLPRALRIPGPKTDAALHFSSRSSKWLDENTLLGKKTKWKGQYKLRHNWSIGACEVQEIHVADRPSVPSMLVKLAEGIVLTVDRGDGLRAWDLKERELIASCALEEGVVPTCLAVDEGIGSGRLGIAVGFMDGGWGTWRLNVKEKEFVEVYRHPESSNGMLSAVAYANPYILTITDSQLLSLYTFTPTIPTPSTDDTDGYEQETPKSKSQTMFGILKAKFTSSTDSEIAPHSGPEPHLLASLKSHTSWPPLSLSIRTTTSTIIASIAYSLPTYYSGYTIGLQELHLSTTTGTITFSRLSSALPQGFSSILPSPVALSPSSGTLSPTLRNIRNDIGSSTRPTTLSYSHPYILATHPDNTLTLYLCTSTASTLHISPGTKLWGHTSSVSSAEITARGKAVSVSTRGNELRVWELEGGFSTSTPSKNRRLNRRDERSVKVRPEGKDSEVTTVEGRRGLLDEYSEEVGAQKSWVGFDDEMVIVLKESEQGTQALMVYDFT